MTICAYCGHPQTHKCDKNREPPTSHCPAKPLPDEERDCPVCPSDQARLNRIEHDIEYWGCPRCGASWTEP